MAARNGANSQDSISARERSVRTAPVCESPAVSPWPGSASRREGCPSRAGPRPPPPPSRPRARPGPEGADPDGRVGRVGEHVGVGSEVEVEADLAEVAADGGSDFSRARRVARRADLGHVGKRRHIEEPRLGDAGHERATLLVDAQEGRHAGAGSPRKGPCPAQQVANLLSADEVLGKVDEAAHGDAPERLGGHGAGDGGGGDAGETLGGNEKELRDLLLARHGPKDALRSAPGLGLPFRRRGRVGARGEVLRSDAARGGIRFGEVVRRSGAGRFRRIAAREERRGADKGGCRKQAAARKGGIGHGRSSPGGGYVRAPLRQGEAMGP